MAALKQYSKEWFRSSLLKKIEYFKTEHGFKYSMKFSDFKEKTERERVLFYSFRELADLYEYWFHTTLIDDPEN